MERVAEVNGVEVGYPEFEDRWWVTIRVIWAVLAFSLLLGMCGLLGRSAKRRRAPRG